MNNLLNKSIWKAFNVVILRVVLSRKIIISFIIGLLCLFGAFASLQAQTFLSNPSEIDPLCTDNPLEIFTFETLKDRTCCDSLMMIRDSIYGKLRLPVDTVDNYKLYEVIETWVGTPYRWAGVSKSGVDCSGFVKNVYQDVYNIDLQRSSRDMAQQISPVKKSELKEGDLIFFKVRGSRIVNHVAIYLKDGYFAHSSRSRGVIIDRIDSAYWKRYYHAAGRCMN